MNAPRSSTPSPPVRLAHATFLTLGFVFVTSIAAAQPGVTTPRAGWRVGGTVHAIARAGNVLFLGGSFRGIAPEQNVAGNMLVVDPLVGMPIPDVAFVNGTVQAIASDGAGGWYVGGAFLDVKSGGIVTSRTRLAHILASGALDPAWAPTVEGGNVLAIEFVPGVGVFVGGEFTSLNGVARAGVGLLDAASGATLPWSYLIGGDLVVVRTLAHHGTELFIGGEFATVDGQPRANLVVTSALASGQMSGDLGVGSAVHSILAVPGSADVYLCGAFTTMLGEERRRLARLAHTPGSLAPVLNGWNPAANARVRAMALVGATLFVGGDFTSIGGQPRTRVAQLDVTSGAPTPFDPGASDTVFSLAAFGSTLYVGGSFDSLAGESRNGAGALDATTGSLTAWNPAPAGSVVKLAVSGSMVAIGGNITGYGAVSRWHAAAVDLYTGQVLPWNPNPDNSVDAMALRDSTVYLGGAFNALGADPIRGLAAVDITLGEPLEGWNPQLNGVVTAMVLDATSAYIGGTFTTAGGQDRIRLARVDLATGAVDPTFAPSADAVVNALALAGSTLYVGGNFLSINSTSATRLAALDAQTGALKPGFSPAPGGNVGTIVVDGDFLYVGGSFLQIGGVSRRFVARLDAVTGAVDGWAPQVALGLTGFVPSVADINVQAAVVMLAGIFDSVDGQPRFGVAAVDKATGALHPWNPDLGSGPYAGFGGPIHSAPDLTIVGGFRIQLSDDILNGLALFVEPAGLNPQPPATLHGTVVGNSITLEWSPSPMALPAASYVVEAGTARGLSNIASINVGAAQAFSIGGVPPGTYYVRVRSVTSLGISAPSPEIAVVVGGSGCTMVPSAPDKLAYELNGSVLTLTWAAGPGAAPTGYTIHAGLGPGASDLTLNVGPTPQFQIPNVPAGAYYWRVAARNGCGISAPSAESIVLVGNAVPAPFPPLGLTGTSDGGNVSLTWIAPPYVPAIGYRVEVGTAPGATIATFTVPTTSFNASGAPPGRYYLRVRAINAAGVSLPSSEIVLAVP